MRLCRLVKHTKAKRRWNIAASAGLYLRGRGVPIGQDGDGERIGFSDFSMRATKRQASTLLARRDLNRSAHPVSNG